MLLNILLLIKGVLERLGLWEGERMQVVHSLVIQVKFLMVDPNGALFRPSGCVMSVEVVRGIVMVDKVVTATSATVPYARKIWREASSMLRVLRWLGHHLKILGVKVRVKRSILYWNMVVLEDTSGSSGHSILLLRKGGLTQGVAHALTLVIHRTIVLILAKVIWLFMVHLRCFLVRSLLV